MEEKEEILKRKKRKGKRRNKEEIEKGKESGCKRSQGKENLRFMKVDIQLQKVPTAKAR
jgi:hypothetical protein